LNRDIYMQEPLPLEKELKKLFHADQPLIIVEAGACEGEDTIKYARLFPRADIYAFEPLPLNIKIARQSFERNKINNVKLINKALSDRNGSALFFVSNGNPPGTSEWDWDHGNKSSSLLAPDKHTEISDFITFDKKITVETITLDEFCHDNGINQIDFIHLDVQGAEMMVLNGARNSLPFVKAIWLEVSTIHLYNKQTLAQDIEKFMHENRFVMVRDCLYGLSGERLYISKPFFRNYWRLFPAWARRRSLLRKVLRKVGF